MSSQQTNRPEGAIFDLDGVITDTAVIHFRAWKQTFDSFLATHQSDDARPFEHDADYVPYVDGKPRYDGVASFLASRGVELPYGDPTDEPGAETICGVGNTKNEIFREIVESGDIPIFQSTMQLVDQLIADGVKCGVASSSRNCRFVLTQTGLLDRFGTVVDGTDSRELGLAGKPAPDIFVTACARLGVAPEKSLMVEDAYSGVEAGRNGSFGLVVGVARNDDRQGLLDRGAHIVVDDLGEIGYPEIRRWFSDR
ncbi:MAG: HAD family hydrolase [Spirochaetota bacterium]